MYTQSSPCSPAIFAPLFLFFFSPHSAVVLGYRPDGVPIVTGRCLSTNGAAVSIVTGSPKANWKRKGGKKKEKEKGEKGNPAPRDSCPALGKSEIRHREVVSGVSRGRIDVGTSRTSLVLGKGGVTDTMRRGKVEVEQGQEFYFEIWGYKMRKPPNRFKFHVWCQENSLLSVLLKQQSGSSNVSQNAYN